MNTLLPDFGTISQKYQQRPATFQSDKFVLEALCGIMVAIVIAN
jgi:hypothetical protein